MKEEMRNDTYLILIYADFHLVFVKAKSSKKINFIPFDASRVGLYQYEDLHNHLINNLKAENVCEDA